MSVEAAKPVNTSSAERVGEQIENTQGIEWASIGDEVPFAGSNVKTSEMARARRLYREYKKEQADAKKEEEKDIVVSVSSNKELTEEDRNAIKEAVYGPDGKSKKEVFTEQEIAVYEKNPKYVTYQIGPGEYKAIKRDNVMDTLEDKLTVVADEDPGMSDINHLMNIVKDFKSGFSEEDKKRVDALKETSAYKIGTLRAQIGQKEGYLESKKKSLDACNAEIQRLQSIYGNFEGSERGRAEYEKAVERANYVKEEISKASNQIQKLNVELNGLLSKEPAMKPYLQGSKESIKYAKDPSVITVPLSGDRGYAIKRNDVVGAIGDLVKNGDEDSEIQMADMLINKVILDGSGFSEEEKKQAEAIRQTPEYKERSFARRVNIVTKQRDRAIMELKDDEAAYEKLMEGNKDLVSRFLNRSEIATAEQRIKSARGNLESAEDELRRLRAEAPLSERELERKKVALISTIRNKEFAVSTYEKDLSDEEEALADLLRNNKNVVDRFMNRKKIKEAEKSVDKKREALRDTKADLSRMNAELTMINKELLLKASGQKA